MYAPSKQGEQPSVEVSKEFVMSPNKLHLEASLDKEVCYIFNLSALRAVCFFFKYYLEQKDQLPERYVCYRIVVALL